MPDRRRHRNAPERGRQRIENGLRLLSKSVKLSGGSHLGSVVVSPQKSNLVYDGRRKAHTEQGEARICSQKQKIPRFLANNQPQQIIQSRRKNSANELFLAKNMLARISRFEGRDMAGRKNRERSPASAHQYFRQLFPLLRKSEKYKMIRRRRQSAGKGKTN